MSTPKFTPVALKDLAVGDIINTGVLIDKADFVDPSSTSGSGKRRVRAHVHVRPLLLNKVVPQDQEGQTCAPSLHRARGREDRSQSYLSGYFQQLHVSSCFIQRQIPLVPGQARNQGECV